MNYLNSGFRRFYHQFIVVPIIPQTRAALAGYQIPEGSNGILTYGFYDPESGFSLMVLATAKMNLPNADFTDLPDSVSGIIPMEEMADVDVLYLMHDKGRTLEKLETRFAQRLKLLYAYDVGEGLEMSRLIEDLDPFRDKIFIDHVLVHLIQKGREEETCWVNITGHKDHHVFGELLEEPLQDFELHKGDTVNVHGSSDKSGQKMLVCTAAGNETHKNASEQLKYALAVVARSGNTKQSINILFNVLRNNIFQCFGAPKISVEERDRILRKAKVTGREEDTAFIQRIYAEHGILIQVALFHNEEGEFIMAFSSLEEMGEYGKPESGFLIRDINISDLIQVGRTSTDPIRGIIINPFSDKLIIYKEAWSTLEKR